MYYMNKHNRIHCTTTTYSAFVVTCYELSTISVCLIMFSICGFCRSLCMLSKFSIVNITKIQKKTFCCNLCY